MKSAKSYFNKALFIKNIKRFWPVWVLYNIAWLIGMPLVLISQLSASYPEFVHEYVLNNALYMGVVVNAIFGFVSALTLYSYLYTSRSVGAFHTLPIRREGLFLTCFLSGLCWLFASNLFIFALSTLVELVYGTLAIEYLLQWLAMVCLEGLFFFSFAVFCAFLTGHGFAHLVIYGILNFVVVLVEAIVRYWTSLFCYGLSVSSQIKLGALSPIYKMFTTRVKENYSPLQPPDLAYNGWDTLLIYAAAGLILALIALLLYRRRQSESASEFIAVPALRPVFLYFFAFIGSLLIGMIFYLALFASSSYNPTGAAWPIVICMILGGFLGYYITAMLLNKSFKVFKKTTPGFIAYVIILSAVVMAMDMDLFGVERYIPDLDSVESVRISGFSSPTVYDDPDVIRDIMEVHSAIIGNKSANERYTRENNVAYYDTISVDLRYTLRNGSIVSRRYTLHDVEGVDRDVLQLLEDKLNTPAAISNRMRNVILTSPSSVTSIYINYFAPDAEGGPNYLTEFLTGDEAKEFMTEIKKDILAGRLGRISVTNNTESENAYYDCYIELYNSRENQGITIVPNLDSENTVAYLKSRGIELRVADFQEKMSYSMEYAFIRY